jgi:benzoylformate decarboxylase
MGRLAGRKVTGTGGQLLVEQLKSAGVKHLFANPGSAEAGFYDALVDSPEIKVVLGLHEGVVASMADGYAKASGQPGVVNVHAIAGTGQMAGQLYNSCRDCSPVVVTAGMLDNEYYTDLLGLSASTGFTQKEVVRQFTKMSWEIRNPEAIPLATRRAFKVATTAPFGPTYVAYASYALVAQNVSGTIYPRDQFTIADNASPSVDAIEAAATLLLDSKFPVFFIGDEVWQSHAQNELLELVEWLGAAVTVGYDAFRSFPDHHPNFMNWHRHAKLPPETDLCVSIGGKIIGGWGERETESSWPIYDKQMAIGMNTEHMARNYPVDLTIVANVRLALRALLDALHARVPEDRMKPIREARNRELAERSSAVRAEDDSRLKREFKSTPIHPIRLSYEFQRVLPAGAIMVNENITADHAPISFGFRQSHNEKIWMGTCGASLGWGLGAAIGAKIGAPDVPVVLSIGDGSVMYSSSAFWTMKRHAVPILVVVWNNSSYQTVRYVLHRMSGRAAQTGHYPGVYLGEPDIDFVLLAKSQGVSGERVTEPDEIAKALQRGLDANKRGEPYLLDVRVARTGPATDSTWH